jgi:two-component system nitrogen regulation response regulator GlnG
MAALLIIDDEPNVLYSLQEGLQSDELTVWTASTAKQGIDLVRQRRPDVVLLDVRLPDLSGLDAFDQIRRLDPRLPVIIITAFAATETAIEAMKRGAFEYLLKPVDFDQLSELLSRAVELSRLRHVPAVFEDEVADTAADRIVGRSAAMQEVCKAVGRVAPQDLTVLLVGESGTGKELIARAIYQHSARSEQPFLAINCAAIPEPLLESELFGHERGAFTGADRRRIGKFEQAHQGTLFLDEIGDMTAPTQAKVLRLLQEQRFERVGGEETIQADVRVIAATNQDLEKLAEAGRFRKDLLYRLNGFIIRLPPLRERREDVPLLVDHFVRRFSRRLRKPVNSVAPEALQLLEAHTWPGNVRELENTIRYALLQAKGDVLTPECLPHSVGGRSAPDGPGPPPEASAGTPDIAPFVRRLLRTGETDLYRKVSLAVDRVLLEEVLRHTNGNQGQACELLGIARNTLRAKLRSLGLVIERQLLSETYQD